MPVHNGEKYLQEAIESILGQTEQDFEFIIVNDGSTDLTKSILVEVEKREKRIIVLNTEINQGLTIALNLGLARAKGKYIARMDADDLAFPDRFSKQFQYLETHPDFVVVGSRVLLIDPQGLPICPFSQKTTHEEIDLEHLAGNGGAICHPSTMIRKRALTSIGGYRPEMKDASDLDLFLRLAEVGKIGNLSETLLKWRMHFDSVGHTGREEQIKCAMMAIQDTWRRRGLPPEPLPGLDTPIRKTHADNHQKWAWWALKAGNLKTSRKHALLAVSKQPFSSENWKVIACAVRGW